MRLSELLEDEPVRVGPVPLPAGRRVAPFEGGQPVAWVTGVEVADPGRVWSALSDLRAQTGLVPVLLEGGEDEEDYFFANPAGASQIDVLDPAVVLAALWEGKHEEGASGPAVMFDAPLSMRFLGLDRPPPGGHSLADIAGAIFDVTTDPAANEELSRLNEIDRRNAGWPSVGAGEAGPGAEPESFPGLAPPATVPLTGAERDAALASLAPARIGLVPAARPADVPAAVGWVTFGVDPYEFGTIRVTRNAVWVGAVLRSFEDRFGATLLKLGPGAELRLLVDRPPRTLEHATQIAAEHSAFCDECAGQGLRQVPAIAAALTSAPTWTFWWD